MGKKKVKRFVGPKEQKNSIHKPANKRIPTSRAKNGGNTNLYWCDTGQQRQPATDKLKREINKYWEQIDYDNP